MRILPSAGAGRCMALLLLSCGVLSGCTVNPYTNRSQLVLTSPSYEGALGAAAYRNIVNDPAITFEHDPLTLIAIQRVAARLISPGFSCGRRSGSL